MHAVSHHKGLITISVSQDDDAVVEWLNQNSLEIRKQENGVLDRQAAKPVRPLGAAQ